MTAPLPIALDGFEIVLDRGWDPGWWLRCVECGRDVISSERAEPVSLATVVAAACEHIAPGSTT